MRKIAIWVLSLCVLASPAAYAGGAGSGDPSGGSSTGNSGNSGGAAAASSQPSGAPVIPAPSSAELQTEIDEMRALVQSQSDQIKKQQKEIAEMKAKLAGSNSSSPAQPAPSSDISAASPAGAAPAIAPSTGVPAVMVASTPSVVATSSLSSPASPAGDDHSPLFFKIGDAKFTPGGFMDATAVFRTTGTGFGIGASFGSLPYNNSLPAAGLTETRFSVQNSRISMRVDAPVGSGSITGYYEADFLGLTAANANVTSNANTLRSRLYFADYNRGHWEFLAGQTWSMLTPGRSGISPWPSDIFFSQDMDTNYQVGLTWARQLGFRVVYHPSKQWALGLSVENPDQLVGSAETFPTAFGTPTGEVDTASGSTLSTPPTANYMPDFIFKIATDQKVGGMAWHFDFAGLLSNFKLVTPGSVLSSTAGTPRQTTTATGGGFEVGANMELFKNFRLIGQGYWSDGGGRYIYGLGPDLVVRQATTTSPFVPSPVKAESSILGFEWQAQPKSLFYVYYGGTEFGRDYSYQPVASGTPTTFVGYGYPTAPATQNRAIQEGTIGWIQDFFKSPNFGKFSLITQASYLTRDPWTSSPTPANPRDAHLVEVYLDIRYTLP
ncbi:MAG: hypothetical protein ACLP1Y_00785 [Candidatus Acidiferrales bacterium]